MSPQATSIPSQVSRSCDRCFSLKTQCDLASVCGRCRRLGLECTNVRPVRPKGRPRKVPTSTGNPENEGLSGLVVKILDPVRLPHLDTELAVNLLEHICCSTDQAHGLYTAMLTGLESSGTSPTILTDSYDCLTPVVVLSLLSIALQVSQNRITIPPQLLVNSSGSNLLREAAISHLPQVLYPYEPKVCDALCLLFLSHTWCLTSEHIEVSLRWWAFAHIIIIDVIKSRVPVNCALLELEQRACLGITLQDSILNLLHYNRADLSGRTNHTSLLTPADSLGESLETSACSHPTSYLALFNPLVRIAHTVLQEPKPKTRAWMDAYDDIEEFYILFPPQLLKFDDLSFLYQAEAMVWMHGLFIVLYVGRDLLNIMLKPNVLDDNTLCHVLGHSLLLAEILPSIERLGGDFSYLSPAIVSFLAISSAVQIATLGKYISQSANDTAGHGIDLDRSPSSQPVLPPEKLLESSKMHIRLLSKITSYCRRYDSPFLVDIQRLLSSCYDCVVDASRPTKSISATTLMLYRWTGRGTGVLPLEPTVAFSEWKFQHPPEDDLQNYLVGHSELSRDIVDEICSPASRICEEGYFDLSIVIP